jgi:hypothetical protein
MRGGGIVVGPIATLNAAAQHADARAYTEAMDLSPLHVTDKRLAEIIAEQRASYTIHVVTISPEVTP